MRGSIDAAIPITCCVGELGGDAARVSDAGQPAHHSKPFKVAQAERHLQLLPHHGTHLVVVVVLVSEGEGRDWVQG